MKKHFFGVFLLLLAVVVLLYVFVFARVAETSQALEVKSLLFSTGQQLAVEIADELSEQVQGLAFRQSLEEGKGMLFTYDAKDERMFWMKDMRFDIDIVWIVDGAIVGIESDIPAPKSSNQTPEIYVSPTEVDMVLEVPAGYMHKQGIEVGAHINVTDVRE